MKAAAELGGTPQQVIANAQTFADWVMKKAELQTSQEQHFAGRQEAQPKAEPQPVDAEVYLSKKIPIFEGGALRSLFNS